MEDGIIRNSLPAIVLLALVACSAGPASPTPGTDTPIEYRRTGGIAGLDQQMVIHPGGLVVVTANGDRDVAQVDDETLTALQVMLEAAGFQSLPATLRAAEPGADRFIYELSYQGHRVTMDEAAVPPRLAALLELLDQIARQTLDS